MAAVVRIVVDTAHVRVIVAARHAVWATLVTTDSYVRGAMCLARSLHDVGSAFGLVVCCTSALSPDSLAALAREACTVRVVERFDPYAARASACYAAERFGDCWTKLRLWEWSEYARIGYLDADMVVVRNMDELLAQEHSDDEAPLLAVQECSCFHTEAAMRSRCPYRAPDGWALGASAPRGARGAVCAIRPAPDASAYFNAGLLVFSPSREEFAAFERELADCEASRWPFAEQDFLNARYARRWAALPFVYNAMKCFYSHHRRDGLWQQAGPAGVRNVHFTHAKPWDLKADGHKGFGRLNRIWWDTFLRHDPKLSAASLQRIMLVLLLRAKGGGGGGGGGGGEQSSEHKRAASGHGVERDEGESECSSDDSGG